MTQHTPGPWEVQPDEGGIMFSGSAGFEITPWGNPAPVSIADLRLIAKAPEMLALLERALDHIESFYGGRYSDATPEERTTIKEGSALLRDIEGA